MVHIHFTQNINMTTLIEEHRLKMGLTYNGRSHNKQSRKLMSQIKKQQYENGLVSWAKGKTFSEEHKHKLSIARKQRVTSEETKQKMRISIKKAHNRKGKDYISQEGKSRLKLFVKGHIVTEEAKNKSRELHKGKHYSPETELKQGQWALDKHPHWQGGKSFEPYTIDFNLSFKESIRERDNRCCVLCNRPQEELGYKLIVHHVDYNKKNSFPQNCISLCRICHIRTNYNRLQWLGFFQSLFKERYDYKYTQDQKIIIDFIGDN